MSFAFVVSYLRAFHLLAAIGGVEHSILVLEQKGARKSAKDIQEKQMLVKLGRRDNICSTKSAACPSASFLYMLALSSNEIVRIAIEI
jgi:hypothetical protein